MLRGAGGRPHLLRRGDRPRAQASAAARPEAAQHDLPVRGELRRVPEGLQPARRAAVLRALQSVTVSSPAAIGGQSADPDVGALCPPDTAGTCYDSQYLLL